MFKVIYGKPIMRLTRKNTGIDLLLQIPTERLTKTL